MQFSEVGTTDLQVYDGFASKGCGLGYFDRTEVLERMILVGKYPWNVSSQTRFSIAGGDIDKFLREATRNARIINEFAYYRADIEMTVRINSNQFYYGALMFTLWPTNATGTINTLIDERAVLNPTIISASTEDSVVKTWTYSYPHLWKPLRGTLVDTFPVNYRVEVLVPLSKANENMHDSIDVQVWARFKNVELSVPKTPLQMQSGKAPAFASASPGRRPFPSVVVPTPDPASHPARDAKDKTSGFATLDAISQLTLGDVANDISKVVLPSSVLNLISMFDKPDLATHPNYMAIEPSADLFLTDVADTSVPFTLYKDRYVDPSTNRMPFPSCKTVSQYAQIPGLRSLPILYAAENATWSTNLIMKHADDSMAIPLDYAWASCLQWRGSIKLCLMFFTSSFVSARFLLQYTNYSEFGNDFDADYSDGISKVIDVKGDTTVTTLLPWYSTRWWSDRASPKIKLTCISQIANNDSVSDPKIYMVPWVSGGEDIQFAIPTVVNPDDWRYLESAPGDIFLGQFPPITENCGFDIDNGWSTAETMGTIASVCKRYSHCWQPSAYLGEALDYFNGAGLATTVGEENFRRTLFGNWRHAFLFRSGGFRCRIYSQAKGTISIIQQGDTVLKSMKYPTPLDDVSRLSLPQIGGFPFFYLTSNQAGQFRYLVAFIDNYSSEDHSVQFLAARDDLQLGFPILPNRIVRSKP